MQSTVYHPIHKRIITRLYEARLETGLTQIDVAKKLRRPQSYVSRVEAGQHRLDIVELVKFAEVYQKPLMFFIDEIANPVRLRPKSN